MSNIVVVDTDILIDVGRGVNEAIVYLEGLEGSSQVAISSITQMEMIVGCRNKAELHELEKFLSRFLLLKVNEVISDQAIELLRQYRLSHGLLIPDALIAATAIVGNHPFTSKNQRDYRFMENLLLLPYPV